MVLTATKRINPKQGTSTTPQVKITEVESEITQNDIGAGKSFLIGIEGTKKVFDIWVFLNGIKQSKNNMQFSEPTLHSGQYKTLLTGFEDDINVENGIYKPTDPENPDIITLSIFWQ